MADETNGRIGFNMSKCSGKNGCKEIGTDQWNKDTRRSTIGGAPCKVDQDGCFFGNRLNTRVGDLG